MEVRNLTLYGRMIYGISCFVKYWNILNKEENREDMKFILRKFCAFTNSEYLDEWQDDVLPLTPACIFEAINEVGNSLCRPVRCLNYNFKYEICEFAKECVLVKNKKRNNEEQKMYELYQKVDNECLYILDMLYNIGASELYGMPTDMKESEQYIIDIINILKNHNVTAPEIHDFKEFTLNKPKKDMDYFGMKIDCTYLLDLL